MSIESRLSALEADKSASLSPNELPIKQDISDSDFVYIHNTSTGKVERVSKSVFNANVNNNGVESYYISPEPTPQTENFFIDVIVADNINNRAEQIPQSSKLIYIYTLFQYGGQSFRKIWVLDNSNRAYGQGTPPIGAGNLIEFNTQALQQNSVVDLGDIGALVGNETYEEHLRDYINAQDPSIGLINSGTIRADFGGDVREFNFSNVTGDYGLNLNQTDVTDFQLYGESNNSEDVGSVSDSSSFNLAIGNVGDVVTTKAELASLFTFNEVDVSSFFIKDNNVFALITKRDYENKIRSAVGWYIPDAHPITFIIETDGFWKSTAPVSVMANNPALVYVDLKIKRLRLLFENCINLAAENIHLKELTLISDTQAFRNVGINVDTFDSQLNLPSLKEIDGVRIFRDVKAKLNFPNLYEVGNLSFDSYLGKSIYAPKLRILGSEVDSDPLSETGKVFLNNNGNPDITVHHSLYTANNGTPDTDLIFAENNGATIKYEGALPLFLSELKDDVGLVATETADTLTSIDLSNPNGNFCNMGTANTNETFNVSNAIAGGNALVLINTVNDITVNGATRITADDHIPNTDMYLYVRSNGVRIEYWLEII